MIRRKSKALENSDRVEFPDCGWDEYAGWGRVMTGGRDLQENFSIECNNTVIVSALFLTISMPMLMNPSENIFNQTDNFIQGYVAIWAATVSVQILALVLTAFQLQLLAKQGSKLGVQFAAMSEVSFAIKIRLII